MNILPKKSWHVFNHENMARVRADEAKAAEEEKERARRKALANQEARTQLLRDRARQKEGKKSGKSQAVDPSSTSLQLFTETPSNSENAERAQEKKAEQEEWEKKIGLLQYLGQDSAEATGVSPWYERKRKRDERTRAPESTDEVDAKKKRRQDPMSDVKVAVERGRKHEHKIKSKHKYGPAVEGGGKSCDMEALRAARLRRERTERAKAQELINKQRGIPEKTKPKPVAEVEQRGYNTQFNPELTRQSKAYRDQPRKLDFDWER